VIVIAGVDIAGILIRAGLGSPDAVKQWLMAQFPSTRPQSDTTAGPTA